MIRDECRVGGDGAHIVLARRQRIASGHGFGRMAGIDGGPSRNAKPIPGLTSNRGRNPYSVPAYRVKMEIQVAVGSETAALAIYRRACHALREIGIEPRDATMTTLLQGLSA